MSGDSKTLLGVDLPKSSWIAMWIFLAAIACVALLGIFDSLRPNWGQIMKDGVAQVSKSLPLNHEKIPIHNTPKSVLGIVI